MAHSLPTIFQIPQIIDVDADAALIQRALAKGPSFFGDSSTANFTSIFTAGVNAALSYSGQRSRKNDLVDKRDESTGYRLTNDEYVTLQQRARSISTYSKIPYDTCEDFLIILCFIDKPEEMQKIADAIQIPELVNPNIILHPMEILNLRGLEKISFAASALDGLINLYRKYLTTAQASANKSNNEDVGSILNTISSLVGGLGGGGGGPRLETSDMGNFLSELITGKRIPNNVIAKNPMLQSPSYIGKAMFGEAANPLANIDIDQLFNKAIAVFPKPSNGGGTSSFSMQNFGSFAKAMPIDKIVSKIVTGSVDITSIRKRNMVDTLVTQINTLTGSKSTDIVEIMRADNAIPISIALSTVFSGFDKSVFSDQTFKQGWLLAQSVGNHMQQLNPQFMEAARKFL